MRFAWAAVLASVAACGGDLPKGVVADLQSPAGATRTLAPQLVSASNGRPAILSWIERNDATAVLKFSELSDSGWTAPRTIASGDDWFVNWADVPSVVRLADGTLAAHWLQKSGGETYAYDVRLSFSKDGGETWSGPTTPHHDGTATEHGFASLFPAPGGGLGLVWLDGRQMKAGSPGDEPEGAMTLRSATFSSDGGQQSEAQIDDRVCECCPTAAIATDDGIVAAYRNRAEAEVRDIYVARFAGGPDGRWSDPKPVHNDDWRIDACPVNGPALAANGKRVAIAWFNAKADQGHVFVAFSEDGGRSFGAPIQVDDAAALGRVDVEVAGNSAAVGWIEYANERAQFRVRFVSPSGRRTASTSVSAIAAGRASGYPRLALAGNQLVLAWTEARDGATTVKTARMQLSK